MQIINHTAARVPHFVPDSSGQSVRSILNHHTAETKHNPAPVILILLISILTTTTALAAPQAPADSPAQFVRTYWCNSTPEHGNFHYGKRVWVNAPEVVLHSRYTDFNEIVAQNGLALVEINENLTQLQAAQLLAETWGGHQGTNHKRVSINGRSTYYFPEVGTALMNNTHQYPLIDLKITDLVNGQNAIQFACDTGQSFWGLFIVEKLALRTILKSDHTYLTENNLDTFTTYVLGNTLPDSETIQLSLDLTPEQLTLVDRVDYIAHYLGYDENGNTKSLDWHGMIKKSKPYAHVATSNAPPFKATFDTSMLLHDEPLHVKATIHFKDRSLLTYETAPTEIPWPKRNNETVTIIYAGDLPAPFASRLNRIRICTLNIDTPIENITRAQLHLAQWDGAPRDNEHPFTLNDHPLDVIGPGHHQTIYSITDIDPAILKQGENTIKLIADTEHHSIEIFLPGPALTIRTK